MFIENIKLKTALIFIIGLLYIEVLLSFCEEQQPDGHLDKAGFRMADSSHRNAVVHFAPEGNQGCR